MNIPDLKEAVIKAAREYYTTNELWMHALGHDSDEVADAAGHAAIAGGELEDALKALDKALANKVAQDRADKEKDDAETKAGIRRCGDCGAKVWECECN